MTLLHAWLIEPFGYDFMQRGLLSALLLSISGGLLGSVLVLRRLALMGDALTHSLLPGLALAWMLLGPGPLALLAGAVATGLITVTYTARAGGGTIVMQPNPVLVVGTPPTDRIRWECTGGTLAQKYRPSECRT